MIKGSRIFSGYVTGPNLPAVTRAQAKKLTHLNVAFARARPDGTMSIEWIKHYLPYIRFLREYNPKLQILLSVGGGGDVGGRDRHGSATDTTAKIARLVNSAMDIVREYDFDGIDCDWEFPGATGNMDEREQFVVMMRAYRAELDIYARERGKKCWLTYASGAWQASCDAAQFPRVLPLLDFLNIMTYDMNEYPPDEPNHACHHANVYHSTGEAVPECCEYTVDLYHRAGVPYEKMVIGAAFYSKKWRNVPGENHGMHQLAETFRHGPGYTAIRSNLELNPDYIKYWDEEAQACWVYDGYSLFSYEDPRSLKVKCDFALKMGLGGMMYWENSYDPASTLFNVLYDNYMLMD